MFENDMSGGGEPPPQSPRLPPLRTFIVRRYNSTWDGEDRSRQIEEITIQAHIVQLNPNGNILQFMEGVIDPLIGGDTRCRRCFNGWLDYEEVYEPQSVLMLPPGVTLN